MTTLSYQSRHYIGSKIPKHKFLTSEKGIPVSANYMITKFVTGREIFKFIGALGVSSKHCFCWELFKNLIVLGFCKSRLWQSNIFRFPVTVAVTVCDDGRKISCKGRVTHFVRIFL